jgi:uncharacterized protein
MNRVFADTSYYIALCNPKDPWNAVAVTAGRRLYAHVVTTEYVILELGNAFRDPSDRALFLALAQHLRSDKHTTLIATSKELLDAGVDLYAARMDKAWSLTDCISFVVMRDWEITRALSCDRHFEQAGFEMLMATE